MIKNLLSILILGLFALANVNAQNQFQRTYNTDDINVHTLDIYVHADGSAAIMYMIDEREESRDTFLGISKLDSKGTLLWSKKYTIGDSLKMAPLTGELDLLRSGGYLASFDIDTLGSSQVMLMIDNVGEAVWSKMIDSTNAMYHERAFILSGQDSFLHATNRFYQDSSVVFLDNFDNVGNSIDGGVLLSSKLAKDAYVGDMIMTQDSGIIITGHLIGDSLMSYVTRFDNEGEIEWSRIYQSDDQDVSRFEFRQVVELGDSSLVVLGEETRSTADLHQSIIMRMDSSGMIMWNRNISQDTLHLSLSNLLLDDMGQLLLSGHVRSADADSLIRPVLIAMSTSGDEIFSHEYTLTVDNGYGRSAMGLAGDGFPYMLYTYRDTLAEYYEPYTIKTMDVGSTGCSMDMFSYNYNSDIIRMDTMIWDRLEYTWPDQDIDVTETQFLGFRVDDISLPQIFYCPDAVIDTTLNATFPGAISYMWGGNAAGETTPIVSAMSTGEYTVTVTVAEDLCFTLCDTANIERFELPTITINPTVICNNDEYVLIAVPSAQAGVQNFQWSTGDEGPNQNTSIIPGEGTYMVTVTDNCGEQAMASIDVPDLLPSIAIVGPWCADQSVHLTAEDVSSTFVIVDYQWSSNAAQDPDFPQNVTIPGSGTYSVTVTDDCGGTTMLMIDIIDPLPPTVTLSAMTECSGGQVFLSADSPDEIRYYAWSTNAEGEMENPTVIPGNGMYSVTVTDNCGNTAETEITINDVSDPSVTIAEFACNNGEVILTSIPDAPDGVMDYDWSANAIQDLAEPQNATIPGDGTYGVTITDECGSTAEAEITVSIPESDVSISGPNCADGGIQLTANTDVDSIQWSGNGISSNNLTAIIPGPGTYQVTIVNECGVSTSESITVTEEDIPQLTLTLTVSECDENDAVRIEVSATTNVVSYLWNDENGSTGSSINVSQGAYSVTVTDGCGNIDSIGTVLRCGACLEFPNVFIPTAESEDNKTFGPVNGCGDQITAYSLVIFNRWGAQVFESTSVADEWNGIYKDEPALGGVYFFYAEWTADGEQESQEGDVTLLR